MIRQVVKDLFSKEANEYWKNEGCNNRMRKYNVCNKILEIINILIIISYILITSVFGIVYIYNINDINEVIKLIINSYEIAAVMIVIFHVINCKIKKEKLYVTVLNIIKTIILIPVISLTMFHFKLLDNFMIGFWLLIAIILTHIIISKFNRRINNLYDVCLGKKK